MVHYSAVRNEQSIWHLCAGKNWWHPEMPSELNFIRVYNGLTSSIHNYIFRKKEISLIPVATGSVGWNCFLWIMLHQAIRYFTAIALVHSTAVGLQFNQIDGTSFSNRVCYLLKLGSYWCPLLASRLVCSAIFLSSFVILLTNRCSLKNICWIEIFRSFKKSNPKWVILCRKPSREEYWFKLNVTWDWCLLAPLHAGCSPAEQHSPSPILPVSQKCSEKRSENKQALWLKECATLT